MKDSEPSTAHKSIIDEAIYLRGRIVSHYSHAEFLLGDFAVKCHALGLYQNQKFKFPYRLENKLKLVKVIAKDANAIRKYGNEIGELIDDIMKFEEIRHFMAHGWMMLLHNKSGHLIEMRLYVQEKGQPLKLEIKSFTLQQMRELSNDTANFVSKMIALFRKIYISEQLEGQQSYPS